VSFVAINLCVASQRVFIVVRVYFVIDSARKLLDTQIYLMGVIYVWTFYQLSVSSSALILLYLFVCSFTRIFAPV
jgi:hypothetical protein